MKQTMNMPCCICGGTDNQLVHEVTYEEQGYPGKFALRRCTECGLLYNSPRLSDAEIGQLYDRNYYFFARRDSQEFRRIATLHQQTLSTIESEVPTKRLLEVGSAKGYLLAVMKERGWDVCGIELSEHATDYARNKLKIDTFCGSVEQFVDADGSRRFPALITTDVIEHVLDPPQFVAALNQSLDVGGLAVVGTPNAGSANIAALGTRWGGFNPFHIYLFNALNLSWLLRRYGFEIKYAYSYNNQKAAAASAVGEDRFGGKLKSWLQRIGLRKAARGAKQLLGLGLEKVTQSTKACVREAVSNIDNSPAYFDTSDGRESYREECRGDNLVIVARKTKDIQAAA